MRIPYISLLIILPTLGFTQNNLISVNNNVFITKTYIKFNRLKNTEKKLDSIQVFNKSKSLISFKLPKTENAIQFDSKRFTINSNDSIWIKIDVDGSKCKNFGFNNLNYLIKFSDSSDVKIKTTWVLDEDFDYLLGKDSNEKPIISFDKTQIQIDTVFQGDTLNVDFNISNRGNSTLILRNIYPSCECTKIKYDKNELSHLESIVLNAKIETEGLIGNITKTISIISNDPKKPMSLLYIRTFVRKN